ncbi:MAG: TIM barrel protein [Spirosomataceae bacterium]
MQLSRRQFIQSTTASMSLPLVESVAKAPIRVKVMATNWGFEGNTDAFCAKAKAAGYDGIELWVPAAGKAMDEVLNATQKHGLELGFLAGGSSANFDEHRKQFEQMLRQGVQQRPLYMNCHTGKDYFSFEQNKALIDLGTQVQQESGIKVLHETHRGKFSFAAHVTKTFLEKVSGLRLTLDISHWCNVAESLLDDQADTVNLALSRTEHIHARIGHAEGPQVNDPRAPEWEKALNKHLSWWDKVVDRKRQAGEAFVSFTTEFGPPSYLPTVPFTQMPLANQWDINVFMMNLLRKRYSDL